MTDPLDLRLVPAAAVAWGAALAVVRLPVTWSVVLAGLLLLAAMLAVVPARRALTAAGGAVLVLLVAAAVLVAGAAQVHSRQAGPWAAATSGGTVRLTGIVTDEARPLAATWGDPRVRVLVTARTVTVDGMTVRTDAPVVLLAPAGSVLPFGAQVEVSGRALATTAGGRAVAMVTTTQEPVVLREPPPWHRAAATVRGRVQGLAETLPGDARALLPGVTVGDTTGVPDELSQAMKDAGLTHLTAVSGAHFTLVAGLVLGLVCALRLPPAVRVGAALAAGTALVLLVHPTASVVRAAAMGCVALVGMLVGRPSRAPAALAATVVLLLVADPWLAGELGFLLSVLATAGLVLLGPVLVDRWSETVGRTCATALAAPVAAQLVCAPAVLLAQPSVSLVAVPANLAAAPAVAPATVLGLAAAFADPWWPFAGAALARVAGAACWWIGAVARTAAAVPGAQVPWLGGPVGVLLLAVASVAGARLVLARRD